MYKKTEKFGYLKNSPIIFIFIIYFVVGSQIYTDFGFYIDEKFHRANGFYWLNYVSNYFGFEEIEQISKGKLNEISGFTLPDIKNWNKYGVIFDLPAAYLEVKLNIKEPVKYYELRHFLVFLIFFIGTIFFYKSLNNRFDNKFISLLGTILLILTPRLFGDSFWNNKDIIFLSFYIISIFWFFRLIDKQSNKNIILFSLFSAVATTIRIAGIFLPISLIFFWILNFISKRKDINIRAISIYLFFFILFLTIFWPLLWSEWPASLFSIFNLDMSWSGKVNFLGNYYKSSHLPQYYLLFWIIVSTPIIHLLLCIHGISNYSKRLIHRYFNIKSHCIYNDLWRSNNEKKDFFIFTNLIFFICLLSLLNIHLYNSWRLGYFLYIFLIYFSTYSIYLLVKRFKPQIIKLILVLFISILFLFYRLSLYHPYQSLYFNLIVPESIKEQLDVDYTGLSGISFLKEIIKKEPGTHKINIAVNSWYPLWRMKELLEKKDRERVVIYATDKKSEADYIFSNRIYDVDKKYHKKYDLPINFKKIKEFKVDKTIIYEVYAKVDQ